MKALSGRGVTTLIPQPNYQKTTTLCSEKNMARHIRTSRKGISPVIATVILVAVAITVAVSVAMWMGGISSLYTRLEKIEISTVNVVKGGTANYTITMSVKNTGSADATIDGIIINGKSSTAYTSPTITITYSPSGGLVAAGSSATVTIFINSQSVAPFTPGTTIDVKLHTAAGKDYPQMVTLT